MVQPRPDLKLQIVQNLRDINFVTYFVYENARYALHAV